MAQPGKDKPLAQNRKARHDYEIIETYEAGPVLKGTEIKSIRKGKMNIQDAYVSIHQGEAWLKNEPNYMVLGAYSSWNWTQ